MLTKIIEFSIKNKLIIGLFIIGLIGYGTYELKHLPIDAVPDITNNQVQIITVAHALGATDIERLITFPIEQANSNVSGLEELRSYSSFGLSVITLVFKDDVDVYWARQQISERLIQVQEDLPKGFGSPFLAPVTTGLGEIYQYTVRPLPGYEDKYDAMDLRTIQDWTVRKQLLGVKGIAEVSSFGGLLKQYEIALEPEKLLANQITVEEIYQALEANNQNTGGSYIEKGPTALFIRSEGLVGSIEDIQSVVIKQLPNEIPIRVGDVGKVQFGHATRYGALTYNGDLQVSGAIVLMLKGANSKEVIENVKNRIEEIKKTLPEGITIEPFIDRTKMVDNAIRTVIKNLIEGALIVVIVLVLFLGNLRAGFIVASIIPLSMLFAIILMNLFGVSGNLMSLGALDFGLIVDGAVIIVEAVMFTLYHQHKYRDNQILLQSQMDDEVKTAASRMMNSAVFGQIIILIVYLPIFTLQGIEGKMFKPMAQTVAFALIGAFILSLTYVPMMSSLLLNKKISHRANFSDRMMMKLEKGYHILLVKALRNQRKIILTVIGLFTLSLFLLSRLGGEFIPALPEGDFAVETRVLPGSNLETSITAVSKASKILLDNFPEVERVVTKTGTSEVPSEPLPIDVSDMIIVLKKRDLWTSAKTYSELESKMSEAVAAVPGVTFSFQYPVAMRFNELISGARQDVVCKIYGDDLDTLAHYAEQLGKICNSVDGSSGLYVEAVSGLPQITIRYNRNAIAQHGLTISEVNTLINTAFAGQASGTVYEGEKRFDLVVRLSENKRSDLQDVQNLLVPLSNGTQIPLNNLAQVEIVDGPNQIQRENSRRRIIVGFNVRGRDIQSTVEDVQQQVDSKIKLPEGYSITYGGAFENLEAAKERLFIAVPLSLALIFLLLFFAFKSVKQSLLIYTAIPLSAIGGIFALYIRDIAFSISAGVGFIALFGVAVLNGIVLIAEFNRLKQAGSRNQLKIVIQGTRMRLRPVLMTAFVASLGFLPMAISTGEGAEVQRPLATVVIGGLLLATGLTLFVLPILYLLFNKTTIKTPKTFVVLVGILLTSNLIAQTPITLAEATKMAIEQNKNLKNASLRADYQQLLSKSAITIPATSVGGQIGQINSIYADKSINLSQTINFPTVYVKQKEYQVAEWKSSILNSNVQENLLRKQVAESYFNLVFLYEKQTLLNELESMFSEFETRAQQRFDRGESDILELATAQNQLTQLKLQTINLEQDLVIANLQFQLLLNSTNSYIPTDKINVALFTEQIDTNVLFIHPVISFLEQNHKLAMISTQLEKSKLAPDITFGYSIMSMRGMGADNANYDGQLKFQSAQVALGIPLFGGSQRAKINAAKSFEKITQNELDWAKIQFISNYNAALKAFQKTKEIVDVFENKTLKNINTLADAAQKQLETGSLNYLEWVMLMNQVVNLKNDYINALKARNNAAVELNYYIQ